jgi:hypothetical protein
MAQFSLLHRKSAAPFECSSRQDAQIWFIFQAAVCM